MFRKIKRNLTYTRIIAIGFLSIVLIGTFLLVMPISSRNGEWTDFIDSAFTATSATCVTGLSVFDTQTHWSIFGQIVILLLIQTGGLGFMTMIAMFSIFTRKRIGLHKRRLIMQSAGTLNMSGIVRMIKRIILGTLIFEGLGVIFLATRFCPKFGLIKGFWYSIFHSVSAFCNAGFDVLGPDGGGSLIPYSSDPVIMITLMLLIVIGGIGFIAWSDILRYKLKFKLYSLHTKIAVTASVLLIFSGAFYFYFSEAQYSLAGMDFKDRLLNSFFLSISPRTAGFSSVSQSSISESGSLVTMILMFIGGSPGSTAGGIKTTTFAVLIISTLACARNLGSTVAFKKKISEDTVRQASSIIFIYLTAISCGTAIISAIEPYTLKEIMYEVISAIATVGLSMGITPSLCVISKMLIILFMYAGRIGGLSIVLALAEKINKNTLERPVEKILIG